MVQTIKLSELEQKLNSLPARGASAFRSVLIAAIIPLVFFDSVLAPKGLSLIGRVIASLMQDQISPQNISYVSSAICWIALIYIAMIRHHATLSGVVESNIISVVSFGGNKNDANLKKIPLRAATFTIIFILVFKYMVSSNFATSIDESLFSPFGLILALLISIAISWAVAVIIFRTKHDRSGLIGLLFFIAISMIVSSRQIEYVYTPLTFLGFSFPLISAFLTMTSVVLILTTLFSMSNENSIIKITTEDAGAGPRLIENGLIDYGTRTPLYLMFQLT